MTQHDSRRVRVCLVTHRGIIAYDGIVLADDGNEIVVEAEFAEEPRDLGYVRLERGDRWTEHYWRDRWYGVKAIRSAAGAFKGWYCDVAWPVEIDADRLVSVDLELDLWVSPDRSTVLRLDEDEFEAFGVAEMFPVAAEHARRAIDELERLALKGAPPFDQSPST
jgi:predicted RNA-binding protein associated with RNAse of E/G family